MDLVLAPLRNVRRKEKAFVVDFLAFELFPGIHHLPGEFTGNRKIMHLDDEMCQLMHLSVGFIPAPLSKSPFSHAPNSLRLPSALLFFLSSPLFEFVPE